MRTHYELRKTPVLLRLGEAPSCGEGPAWTVALVRQPKTIDECDSDGLARKHHAGRTLAQQVAGWQAAATFTWTWGRSVARWRPRGLIDSTEKSLKNRTEPTPGPEQKASHFHCNLSALAAFHRESGLRWRHEREMLGW